MSSYRILYHHRIRAEDGQAVHVREMIGALRAMGHEVLECALVPKADGSSGLAREDAGSGSFWQKLQLPRSATECAEILYSRKGASMIRRGVAEFRPDFVYERHALHCRAALDGAGDVPVLLEVNSPFCDEMSTLGLLQFKNLARRTERAVFQGVQRVLPVSDVLAERVIELGAPRENVSVIRNGADPSRYTEATKAEGLALRKELGLDTGQLVLGFIGYMRPWHRLDMVLDAMSQVGRSDMHLVLAGEGPALAPIQEQARRLGFGDRVHALGAVPGSVVPSVASAFDVALVPAINSYASPLKVFDSLNAGVATLALDQPNIRELLTDGETGLLFQAGDVGSLVSRLQEIVGDRERLAAIGRAGREAMLANRWTWQGSAERVIETYEGLLEAVR